MINSFKTVNTSLSLSLLMSVLPLLMAFLITKIRGGVCSELDLFSRCSPVFCHVADLPSFPEDASLLIWSAALNPSEGTGLAQAALWVCVGLPHNPEGSTRWRRIGPLPGFHWSWKTFLWVWYPIKCPVYACCTRGAACRRSSVQSNNLGHLYLAGRW